MKKILKGILLWITVFTIMLFVGGIDSIVDKGLGVTLAWIAICIALYNLCRVTLSIRELCTLSGYKFFYKLMN